MNHGSSVASTVMNAMTGMTGMPTTTGPGAAKSTGGMGGMGGMSMGGGCKISVSLHHYGLSPSQNTRLTMHRCCGIGTQSTLVCILEALTTSLHCTNSHPRLHRSFMAHHQQGHVRRFLHRRDPARHRPGIPPSRRQRI